MDYLTGSSVPETIWYTGIDPVIRGWGEPGGEEGEVTVRFVYHVFSVSYHHNNSEEMVLVMKQTHNIRLVARVERSNTALMYGS